MAEKAKKVSKVRTVVDCPVCEGQMRSRKDPVNGKMTLLVCNACGRTVSVETIGKSAKRTIPSVAEREQLWTEIEAQDKERGPAWRRAVILVLQETNLSLAEVAAKVERSVPMVHTIVANFRRRWSNVSE